MEDFGLTSLYARAAAASPLLPPPSRAPRESLRCRAFDERGRLCKNIIQYHDHVCHEHVDYYRDWWRKNMKNIVYIDAIGIGSHFRRHQQLYLEEFDFQLGGGYVDFDDPYFKEAMCHMETIICDIISNRKLAEHSMYLDNTWNVFFLYLCSFQTFNPNQWPAFLTMLFLNMAYGDSIYDCGNTKKVIHHLYNRLLDNIHINYKDLLRIHIEVLGWMYSKVKFRGYDFAHYIAKHLENLPQPFCCCTEELLREFGPMDAETKELVYSEADFISSLAKNLLHGHMSHLRSDLMAATWAPKRLPFWTLDEAEIAETFRGGIRPTYDEWLAICEEADSKADELSTISM